MVRRALAEGYDVCVGLTPAAARWLADAHSTLEDLTGRPVRSTYKKPGEPDVWPPADVILFAAFSEIASIVSGQP